MSFEGTHYSAQHSQGKKVPGHQVQIILSLSLFSLCTVEVPWGNFYMVLKQPQNLEPVLRDPSHTFLLDELLTTPNPRNSINQSINVCL